MSVTSTLLAAGTAAFGYWVIRSVLRPGIDLIEAGIKAEQKKVVVRTTTARNVKNPVTGARLRVPGPSVSRQGDYAWYVVLDVPQSAGRIEVQEALRRRLTKARSDGDRAAPAQLMRAAAAGIREPQRGRATATHQ